jgi:HTH-type transcriptional regulator / antitoxin HigA
MKPNKRGDDVTHDRGPFLPDWASPPGDTLASLLDERSMTQTELAERLGVSLKHVNRVVKGAASISGELALGLEKVLGASADFWMTREAHFQADRARQEQRGELAKGLDWARKFPLRELRKRGRIKERSESPHLVEELLGFLGIAHPSQWKDPQVAYRKSQKFESDPFALSAWLREGELFAQDVECAPYDEDRFLQVLQQARSLTRGKPGEWWPKLQELAASAGVAVVVVDTYAGAKANGATRWLSPDKALIQLSIRHRWEDIFWFSFFHESGHVVLHRKKDRFKDLFVERDGRQADNEQPLEEAADRFAARTLIPPPHDRRLPSLVPGEVVAFAEMIGVAPAIVIGRLQHDGLLPYSQGNKHRRRLALADETEEK